MQKPELKTGKSKDFLDASLARKLDVLKKEADEINSEIDIRTLLHAALVNEQEMGIKARKQMISELGGWRHGSAYESRITVLEREINDFRKEARIEQISYWRDISRQKESLRKVMKEIWLLQGKKEFLGTYLEKLAKIEW